MPPTEVSRKFSELLLGDGYCNGLARRPSRHRVGLDSRGAGRDAVRAHARTHGYCLYTTSLARARGDGGNYPPVAETSLEGWTGRVVVEVVVGGGEMGNKPNKSRFTSLLIVFIDHRSDHFHT